MLKKVIWCACKDPGGTKGILEIIKVLKVMGHDVTLFASGKAVEILTHANQPFLTFTSNDALQNLPRPDVLVTSMCSSGGVGQELMKFVDRKKTRVVAVQDYWGAYLWDDWAEPNYRPDYILVNDKIGAQLVLKAWKKFPSDAIICTGFPALDRYIGLNVDAMGKKARYDLMIPEDAQLVVYCGQLSQSSAVLAEVVKALNEIALQNIYLIARMHPRMKDDARYEMHPWSIAIENFRGNLIDPFLYDLEPLLAAANVVVSMYSTTLVEAAAMRKPNISVLYTNVGLEEFHNATGNEIKLPPIVSLGCSALASDYKQLRTHLSQVLTTGDLGLVSSQETHLKLDGKNALRAAQFINSIR